MANTSTASELLDTVSRELEDPSNDTWGRFELLLFLNDGLRALASFRPGEFTGSAIFPLAAGARQTVSQGVMAIYRALGNTNIDGSVRGRAIRTVLIDSLDAASPNWRNATPSATIRECAIPPDQSVEYWVNPPAVGGGYIELLVAQAPQTMLNASPVPCSPEYYPALVDYTVYRALAKDAEYGAQDGRAQSFYAKFLALAAPPQPAAQGA